MKRATSTSLALAALFAGAVGFAAPASAQATRTWVSGVGDDVNPCSRTAPCKTFAGAISKTAAGGEINCLDPASFGVVTITKSISLICEGGVAGILASGSNAINVNGTGITVLLSGFDFNGIGNGLSGVNFLNGSSLHIRNSTIRGFSGSTSPFGIKFAPSDVAGATLVVDNVTLENNGTTSGVTGGVLVQPGTGVPVTVLITNSRVTDNNRGGVRLDASSSGSSIKAVISDSQITDNQIGLYARSSAGGGTANVTLVNSVISGNSSSGVLAEDALATVTVSNSLITQNGNGVRVITGGALVSQGGNVVVSNTNNGSFTSTIAKQ
ncbi:right-handed parallel beta-helix repeat-containing protein [Sphingopyxis sp. KK2]|uniref:right-handed parallel beta-helix repeat-containing protein n=1 Tax=Sphingopyxis sp. KK2 TaxID=1855727 RepID=UPI00097E5EF5|nr:right-handed parallel beta-helix repeat-containing protein [Sphingopyxis sp. KK2]